MPDYKKMYLSLFNDVSDVIESLKQAQIKTEEIYMDSADANIAAFPDFSENKPATD